MDATTLFINAIDHWRDAKGVGTALIPPPLEDKAMILGILQKIYDKRNNVSTLIITNTFIERENLVEYLTHQNDENNNTEFKRLLNEKYIKVYTFDYIKTLQYNQTHDVTILYHCDRLCDNVFNILNKSKFKLVIFNKFISNKDVTSKIYSICPLLNDFKQKEIDSIRISTPVEEMRIGIDIPTDSEAFKLLKYYDEYITTSINIFGSFDNIQYARVGNNQINLSATQFCYTLALENGWNEHLDMNIELNVQIDELYNPANIRDRASQTYEIMRNRRALLANYDAKLDEILKIVKEHSNEKILIISKYAEFASKITDFLNNMSETTICGNYHDKVESVPATTVEGTPIFIKSGVHKGERKMIAAKAQKKLNEEKFNKGFINVLSTNNSPDKDLNILVNVIIITSPECEDIKSYLYRLGNVKFDNNNIKLYSLYIKNSSEEKKLQNKTISETHKIIENVKNENNFNFIVVD